jgi:glycosyltransferase involved in cell wall biosynthesis
MSHVKVNVDSCKQQPVYSICITNFNTVDSIKASLESILNQIDSRFEIVVVDNCSTDGSLEILKEYERQGVLRLIVKRCSRGLGRQTAVEASNGKYVINHLDMDDVFLASLNRLLQVYHASFEGKMLVTSQVVMVAPKQLILNVGGYRDLNYLEDKELFSRAAKTGCLRYLEFKIKAGEIKKANLLARTKRVVELEYMMYRASLRLGKGTVFFVNTFCKSQRLKRQPVMVLSSAFTFPWAYVTSRLYPHFKDGFIEFFDESFYGINLKSGHNCLGVGGDLVREKKPFSERQLTNLARNQLANPTKEQLERTKRMIQIDSERAENECV